MAKQVGGLATAGDRRITEKKFFIDTKELTNLAFTGTNAVTPTTFLSEAGGGLLLTQAGADNDACLVAFKSEAFRLNTLNAIYEFQFIAQVNDATQADFFAGIVEGAWTIASPTNDYLGFWKADDATDIDVRSRKNGAGETAAAVATMTTTNTLYGIEIKTSSVLGIAEYIKFFINGKLVKRIDGAVICDDEEMKVMVGNQNGEAVAKTCKLRMIAYDCPLPWVFNP